MGQFSWKTADTNKALLINGYSPVEKYNCTTKAYLLIPEEFGGGYFSVNNSIPERGYDGYGIFFDQHGKKVDVFVELARWNGLLPDNFDYNDKTMVYEARDKAIELYYTAENPNVTMYEEGNYNSPNVMKYPLKITEKMMSYADADTAIDDPNQGWGG